MYLHTTIALVLVSLASCFSPATAQAQIGKVVAATGTVAIEHVNAVKVQVSLPSQASQTKVGDLVYQGDVIRTGGDGRISIVFADDTTFNLSNNANMTLDEFVYDPKGKSNSTVFTLGKGVFTFVAGKIAQTGDMKVETQAATMGIRGTTPHVEILEDGTAKFSSLIEEGKIQVVKKLGTPAADQKLNLNICRGC